MTPREAAELLGWPNLKLTKSDLPQCISTARPQETSGLRKSRI
jgi:hypothetical protein